MKISYANMIGDLVKRAGGDPQTVLNAISQDSRVGDKCMKWGYGYGGPCFPRDNLALQEYANGKDVKMLLSSATDDANDYHLHEMFRDITQKEHADGIIRFPYITYKPSSVITERSFPLALATQLANAGYSVEITERQCVIDELKRTHGDVFKYQTI